MVNMVVGAVSHRTLVVVNQMLEWRHANYYDTNNFEHLLIAFLSHVSVLPTAVGNKVYGREPISRRPSAHLLTAVGSIRYHNKEVSWKSVYRAEFVKGNR